MNLDDIRREVDKIQDARVMCDQRATELQQRVISMIAAGNPAAREMAVEVAKAFHVPPRSKYAERVLREEG